VAYNFHIMRRAVLALAAAAGCVLSAGLRAQSPAERAALEAFRDSLARLRDTTVLVGLEADLIAVARADRDNPFHHLRLGFLAYRLGEVGGGRSHYDDAAGEFEWASELAPQWPYAWYGLGLAELALGEHQIILIENVRQMLGQDYLSKAAASFARATQADPQFTAAVVDLAATALSQRINARLDVAHRAARLAARGPAGRDPAVQLARGRLEREVGEADSAVAAFRAALAAGADSGLALLELARSQYYARRSREGWAAYFAGARAAASVAARAEYRADLSWVASPEELAAFDALADPAARTTWLVRFWTQRDADEARDTGERLREHYRRWFYARRHFRLVSRHRHYDIAETYRGAQAEFDDRGVIYLRHGDPDDRAAYLCPPAARDPGQGCEPNESWRYRRREGDFVFHFVARADVQDYKLVESLVDVLGFGRAVQAQGTRDPAVEELYDSRRQFGEPFSRLGHGMGMRGSLLAEERALGRRSIALGTATDSYRHRFGVPLAVRVADFVVGRREPDPPAQELHLVFAIPAARLPAVPAAGGVQYPLQFRLRVLDEAGGTVAALDTVRVFAAATVLGRDDYLTGLLSVAVPAGPLRYRLLVAVPGGEAGDLVAVDTLAAPALDGGATALSDLVLGRDGSGLAWLPPGDTVPLNPLGRYPQGSTIELYYEVHGLAAGGEYRTEITLEPAGGRSLFGRIRGLFGGRRSPVQIAFDAVATGPVTRVRRAVELGDLKRGAYQLTVRVADPRNGATLARQRRIEVVAPGAS
jgi:GWxTD domain-containing protein